MDTLTLKVQEGEYNPHQVSKSLFLRPTLSIYPLVRGIDCSWKTGSSNLFLGQRPERDQRYVTAILREADGAGAISARKCRLR